MWLDWGVLPRPHAAELEPPLAAGGEAEVGPGHGVAVEDVGGVEEAVGMHEGQAVEDVVHGIDGAAVAVAVVLEETGGGPCDLHHKRMQVQGLG